MSTIIYDIEQLYQRVFGGKPYFVGKGKDTAQDSTEVIGGYSIAKKGSQIIPQSLLTTDGYGVEVWLPVWFEELPTHIGDNGTIFLPYSVVKISGSSTIIRTPMAERIGTAKELYTIDDYKITIKGFFIDKEQRLFPDKDLSTLKKLNESGQAFRIRNAITDIFLSNTGLSATEQGMVVITSFDLPEVEGGRKHVKPFSMTLESDTVFTLTVR